MQFIDTSTVLGHMALEMNFRDVILAYNIVNPHHKV